MNAALRPRWLVLAALTAVIVGAGGLLAGDARYSPMAWLLAELLIIYAAILWATPTIPPLSTVPADAHQEGTNEQPAASVSVAGDAEPLQ